MRYRRSKLQRYARAKAKEHRRIRGLGIAPGSVITSAENGVLTVERYCVCGHLGSEHHATYGLGSHMFFYEECEHYGFNENGGLQRRRTLRHLFTPRWTEHCMQFRPQ